MSPRSCLLRSWAKAQGTRAAAIQHTLPQCVTRSLRRTLSSTRLSRESDKEDVSNSDTVSVRKTHHTKARSRNRKIFSLIQPTGIPHLGNYLGALRTWKDFQDEKDARNGRNHMLMFGIADLHSLTSKQDPAERRDQIRKTFASLLAIGLDPAKSMLFLQSDIYAHSELMWILSNVASTGYLSRMTQWKEKIGLIDPESSNRSLGNLDEKSQEKLKLSLFSYPVLQAADILLYQPDTVPVGEDQAQHVEFTRQLARSFNAAYRTTILQVPELLLSPAKRIMSLQDPTRKMSKSDTDSMSRILITDTPEEIKMKFKKAKTDSTAGPITYSPAERPGVSNLIDIYKHVQRDRKSQDSIAADLKDMTLGALKGLVADVVIEELHGVREQYLKLIDEDNNTLDAAIMSGRKLATARAGGTMAEVRKAIGLYSTKGKTKQTTPKKDILQDRKEPERNGTSH